MRMQRGAGAGRSKLRFRPASASRGLDRKRLAEERDGNNTPVHELDSETLAGYGRVSPLAIAHIHWRQIVLPGRPVRLQLGP